MTCTSPSSRSRRRRPIAAVFVATAALALGPATGVVHAAGRPAEPPPAKRVHHKPPATLAEATSTWREPRAVSVAGV